jgi:GH24 family phage-related lysozyme (muramidase)
MNINTLREEIEADEGVKYELYHCSENHLTGGIGHLITEWDTDYYGKPIGYPVPEQQVQDWFLNDVQTA